MGRKPSIFSKNYRKRVRRRKIRIVTIIVAVVLVAGIGIATVVSGDKLSAWTESFLSSVKSHKVVADENSEQGEEDIAAEVPVETPEPEEKDETLKYDVELESGKKVGFTYKEEGTSRKIQVVQGGLQLKCVISPSQDTLLILDEESQDIYLLDKDNNLNKITNPQYVSTDKQVFTKEAVLNGNSGYKWVSDAAFIDDTHVAYASGLPWINQTNSLYLWIYDVSNKSHKGYYNVKGQKLVFGEIAENGLKVSVDDKETTINAQGTIVK